MTIIEQIAERHAAARVRLTQRRPCFGSDVSERAIAEVVIRSLWLAITRTQRLAVYLGIHVAIGDQEIRPPTVIEVVELHSPSKPAFDLAQASAVGDVIKIVLAAIPVERRGVVAEIGFDDVLKPAVREIVGGKAHARLLRSILVVRHAGFLADLCEGPIVIVVVKKAGCRVAGNINIRTSVTMQIFGQRGEAIARRCIADSRLLRDMRERAISVVVIERVHSRLETSQASAHINSFPLAPASLTGSRNRVVAEVDVAN